MYEYSKYPSKYLHYTSHGEAKGMYENGKVCGVWYNADWGNVYSPRGYDLYKYGV